MFRPLFLAVLAGLVAFAAAKTRLTGIRLEAEDTMDLPPLKMPDLPSSFIDVSGGSSGAAAADTAAKRGSSDLITTRLVAAHRAGSLDDVLPVAASGGDAAVAHMAQGMHHLAREIKDLQIAVNAAKRARPIPKLYVHGHPELSQRYPRAGSAGAAAAASAPAPRSGMVTDLKSINRGPVGRAKSPPGTIANPPTPAPGVGAGTPISFSKAAPATAGPQGGFKEVAAPTPEPSPVLTPGLKRGPVGRLRPEPVQRMVLPSLAPLIAGLNPGATSAAAAVDAAANTIAHGSMAHALGAPQAAALAAAAAAAQSKVLVAGANRGPVGRFDPAKKAAEEAKTAEDAKAKADATFVPATPAPAAAGAVKGGFKEVSAPAPTPSPVLTPELKRGPVGRLDPAAADAERLAQEKEALATKGFNFPAKPSSAPSAAPESGSSAFAAPAAAPASPVLTPELKRGPVGRRDPAAEAAKQAKIDEEAKQKAAALLVPQPPQGVLSPAPAAAVPGAAAEAAAKARLAAKRARGNGKIPKKRGPVGRLREAVADASAPAAAAAGTSLGGKGQSPQVVRLAKDMFKHWVAKFKAGQVVQV